MRDSSERAALEESWIVIDEDEGKIVKEAMKGISHVQNKGPQLDLLDL